MKNYEHQIRDYKKFAQEKCINEKKEEQTIKICQSILTEQTLKNNHQELLILNFYMSSQNLSKKDGGFYRVQSFYFCGFGLADAQLI